MMNTPTGLIVFDMAGTTVRDDNEVLHCFSEASRQAGLSASEKRLNALMGVSKLEVFQLLWREELGANADTHVISLKADETFKSFCRILETYYSSHPVEPTEGALEVFEMVRSLGIRIALNTGFYRKVTDIILGRLGWLSGLDAQYIGGNGSIIDFSVTSDEVPKGRPEPYMIQKAMSVFGITNAAQVVKIGDTPVDLEEGRRAGAAYSIAVTNGTHTRAELELLDNDGLLGSLSELPGWLQERGWPAK